MRLGMPTGTIRRVLVASSIVGIFAGCAAKGPKPNYSVQLAQYRRLAIVCAPGPGADPTYASSIMYEVEKMAPSRLDFLERVDILANVPVGTMASPPSVKLKNADAYDGIVALVYSYPAAVLLDMYMIDARSGQEVWHYQLSTEDKDIPGRLARHGYWTPTTIKNQFYGK
jgi:hypothetical protein